VNRFDRVNLSRFSLSMARLQCTTKGTKALRLLGDGGIKNNCEKNYNRILNNNENHNHVNKDSVLNKLATRGNLQRRLLLKNGEVNISRYATNELKAFLFFLFSFSFVD
jgi:hypothetical protein